MRDGASIGTAKAGSDELFLLYSESYIPDATEKLTRPEMKSTSHTDSIRIGIEQQRTT